MPVLEPEKDREESSDSGEENEETYDKIKKALAKNAKDNDSNSDEETGAVVTGECTDICLHYKYSFDVKYVYMEISQKDFNKTNN